MFNKERLQEELARYKSEFANGWWEEEKYKWEAIKAFQENWDIDSSDFPNMLHKSLLPAGNLLGSYNYYPRRMIFELAQEAPEVVREMFKELFKDGKDVVEQILVFLNKSDDLLAKYGKGKGSHYQDVRAISTYLWLRYPNKCYMYKHSEVKNVAKCLEYDYHFMQGSTHYEDNLRHFYALYDEVCENVGKDVELIDLLKSKLTDSCYADPAYKALTTDICYNIAQNHHKKKSSSKELPSEDKQQDTNEPKLEPKGGSYWWLNANPKIWSYTDIDVGETKFYTLYNDNGNKRRIFQNFLDVKPGDKVIGYEATPVKQIVALCEIVEGQDGKEIKFKKTEHLSSPVSYAELKECPELAGMEFFANLNGSLFRLSEDEYDFIMDRIREGNPINRTEKYKKYTEQDFLNDVFMDKASYDNIKAVLEKKKNIILQGAPGVGKTYMANRLAYSIMGEMNKEHVAFIQFHQNYSYEDFIMGYKPDGEGFTLKTGVFHEFCTKASNHPDEKFFFIIDEINRGNMSKIFGELLILIENDYRGMKIPLAYDERPFSVPKNLYIIGMMNTADRSLAMIDYALRRRFSFIEIVPAFDSDGFKRYQKRLNNETLNKLIATIKELNEAIATDGSLGKGFVMGHSYFCQWKTKEECTKEEMERVVRYDIIPMLEEYWFDEEGKLNTWKDKLLSAVG